MKRIIAALFLLIAVVSTEIATTYYASPTGVGATCSLASPGTAIACLAVASGGDTLILKNGTYTGDSGMLHPPNGRSGTAGNVITVTAETDGGVLIDGQGGRIPVLWDHNDYWTVSGINAANSSSDVMSIYPGSDNNIFSRICAWNANPNGNNLVWQFWQANNNLAVDTCAFGTGRKMYASFEMSGLTLRRPFAMWNHINVDTGPFIVYSLFYDSDHVIIENPIGTRDEDSDSFPGGATDQGIFSADRLDEYNNCELGSGYYGGLALILGTQNVIQTDNHGGEIHGSQVAGSITFQDDLLYITPGTHPTLRRILMAGYDSTFTGGCAATTLTANRKMTNVTTIGQGDGSFPNLIDTSSPNNGWTNTNYTDVNSIASIYPGSGETLYVGSAGTKLRYQYQNGVLTSTPLWPWAMNQRIKDAMLIAGRTPFDVNATVTGLFGTSPDVNPAGTPPIQNFDSNTTNANLDGTTGGSGGWNAAWSCDSSTTMTTPLAPGGGQGGPTGKSVLSASALGGGKYCFRTFDAVAAGSFRFEMRTSALPNSDDYGMMLNEANVGPRVRIDMRSDSNISAYNYQTSAYVPICVYSLNVFYRLILETDAVNQPNKYRARCGENGTNTAWIGTNGTFSVANTFTIDDNATNAHNLYVDAIGATTELSSVTPSTGAQGATIAAALVGLRTGWINSTSVCSLNPATNITINSTVVADATDATCNFTIGAGAATGLRDVIITTGTEAETLPGAFNITSTAPPVVTHSLGVKLKLRIR